MNALKGIRTFVFITVYLIGMIALGLYSINRVCHLSSITFPEVYALIKDLIGFFMGSIGLILGYIFGKKKYIDENGGSEK